MTARSALLDNDVAECCLCITAGLVITKPQPMRLNGTCDSNGLEPFVTKLLPAVYETADCWSCADCGVSSRNTTSEQIIVNTDTPGIIVVQAIFTPVFRLVVNTLLQLIAFNVQYNCI